MGNEFKLIDHIFVNMIDIHNVHFISGGIQMLEQSMHNMKEVQKRIRNSLC